MTPVRLDAIAKHLEDNSIYGPGPAPEGPITLTEEEQREFAGFPDPHREYLARLARRQPSAVFQQVLAQLMRELAKANADAVETLKMRWPEGYEYLRLVAALPLLGLPVSSTAGDDKFRLHHDPDIHPFDYLTRWELADITVLRDFFIRHGWPLPADLIDTTEAKSTPATPIDTYAKITPVDAYAKRHGMTLGEVFHAIRDGRLTVALRVDDELVYAWKREPGKPAAILALCRVTGLMTVPGFTEGEHAHLLQGTGSFRIAALRPLPNFPPKITVINDAAYGEPYLSLDGLMPPFEGNYEYRWLSGEPGMPVDNALDEIERYLHVFLPATAPEVTRTRFVVVEEERWSEQLSEAADPFTNSTDPQLAAVELRRLLAMLKAAEPDADPTQTVIDLLGLDDPNAPALNLYLAHPRTGDHESRPPISRNAVKTALSRLHYRNVDPDSVTVTANPGQKNEREVPVRALWIVRNDWRDGYAARGRWSYPWPSSSDAATFCWWSVVEDGKPYHAFMADRLTGNVDDFAAAQTRLWTPFEAASWLLSTRPEDAERIGQRYDLTAPPNRYVAYEDTRHIPDFVTRFRRLWRDIDDAIALGELVPKGDDKRLIPGEVVGWAKKAGVDVPEGLVDMIAEPGTGADSEMKGDQPIDGRRLEHLKALYDEIKKLKSDAELVPFPDTREQVLQLLQHRHPNDFSIAPTTFADFLKRHKAEVPFVWRKGRPSGGAILEELFPEAYKKRDK